MKDVLTKVDKNGTKYWANYTCPRCGGAGGSDAWAYTGWTCYKCGGTGRAVNPLIWKEYTEEYAAKLQAQREKREQKRIAKLEAEWGKTAQKWLSENNFNSEGKTFLFLGNTYEMRENIKAVGGSYNGILGWHIDHEVEGYQFLQVSVEECTTKDLFKGYSFSAELSDDFKARCKAEYNKLNAVKDSEWIGEIGERIDVDLTLSHVAQWEQNKYCGYGTELVSLYTFKDAEGNAFVWKTTNWIEAEEGAKVHVRGTIKDHSEYKGTKQTVLTRCKIIKEV